MSNSNNPNNPNNPPQKAPPVDPTNDPSIRVIGKLGFTFWKQAEIDGYIDNLYRRTFS